MGNFFIKSICGFASKKHFILRPKININVTKKIAFLEFKDIIVTECASREFTKSYLSRGLYKIPISTGLHLGRKISMDISMDMFLY